MPIPDNINRDHILKALGHIDENGIPNNRKATRYYLYHENKCYPPKYVISIANVLANKVELDPATFTGGKETNSFLMDRGFEIVLITDKTATSDGETRSYTRINPRTNETASRQLTKNDLLTMRGNIVYLLNQMDSRSDEGVARKIARLSRENRIPREMVPLLRTITEFRNIVEYENRELTLNEQRAVLAAWGTIRKWASNEGYQID